jgi:DNA end-binding protein Ku
MPARPSGAGRPSWSGMLRFGLVAFPVQAYNAQVREAGGVQFHQLHAPCHSRIRYEKHCPIHGRVPNEEIVSGYEVAKNEYVEIDPAELRALRTKERRGLSLDAFIDPAELDPIYFDGRMYLLAPDGAEAEQPYAVFVEALVRRGKWGIGQIVFSGREQVVALRPWQSSLHMAMLNYAAEIRTPADLATPPKATKTASKEVALAERLIDAWAEEAFDFAKYEDHYVEQVRALIKSRAEGRGVVVPEEEEEEAPVVNLMEALQASLGKGRRSGRGAARRPSKAKGKRRRAS